MGEKIQRLLKDMGKIVLDNLHYNLICIINLQMTIASHCHVIKKFFVIYNLTF